MCMTKTELGRLPAAPQQPGARNTQSLGESPGASPKRLWSRAESGSVWWSEQFWGAKFGSVVSYWPKVPSPSAFKPPPRPGRASKQTLEGRKACATGHSQMELLCRVLAEGVSAPSARKYAETGIWSKFHMKAHKAPRMASGPAPEAARGATACRSLCEARSSGERGA